MAYLIAFFISFLTWQCEATTVERFSLDQLATQSEQIHVVTCLESSYEYADGQPITRYKFAVTETIKGPPDAHITLHLPGGIIGAFESRIAGMPTFSVGSQDVLFLTAPNRAGFAWPMGLGQGAFQIRLDGNDAPAYTNASTASLYTIGPLSLPPKSNPFRVVSWRLSSNACVR